MARARARWGVEGIAKRKVSRKSKTPTCEAVRREAEEDWGR